MASGRFFPVQTIHLGQKGTVAGFNEETLAVQPGILGCIFEKDNKAYRIVKVSNNGVPSVAASAAHWYDRPNFVVTQDKSFGTLASNGIAGGFLGVLTDGYYGIIQVGGAQAGVLSDGSANAAGDLMVGCTADTNGALMLQAAANQLAVAIATAGDGGGTTNAVYWLLGSLI
jgi:hypothetical protein